MKNYFYSGYESRWRQKLYLLKSWAFEDVRNLKEGEMYQSR